VRSEAASRSRRSSPTICLASSIWAWHFLWAHQVGGRAGGNQGLKLALFFRGAGKLGGVPDWFDLSDDRDFPLRRGQLGDARRRVLKFHAQTGVEALAARFEDGGGVASGLDGGEVFAVTEDEVGNALIAVAGLSGEIAVGIGSVAEEEGIG
jgi:hypothetical protein